MDILIGLIEDMAAFAEVGGGAQASLWLLVGFIFWELLSPRRPADALLLLRWSANISLMGLNLAFGWLLVPLSALAVAWSSAIYQPGLFGALSVPMPGQVVAYVLIVDAVFYGWHRLSHSVPILWRLHAVHHSDVEMDVGTSFRHHPVEILLSLLPRTAVIVVLGAPVEAVLVYELIRAFPDTFSHANIQLPKRLERLIRLVVITPDMHRIHHSAWREETDSNFSSLFPWWDYLFGTFRWRDPALHSQMVIGLETLRDRKNQRIDGLLIQPLYVTTGSAQPNPPLSPPGSSTSDY